MYKYTLKKGREKFSEKIQKLPKIPNGSVTNFCNTLMLQIMKHYTRKLRRPKQIKIYIVFMICKIQDVKISILPKLKL